MKLYNKIQVCLEREWDIISGDEIRYLEALKKLLEPFYKWLVLSQKESGSLEICFRTTRNLIRDAEAFKTNCEDVNKLAKSLAEQLRKRFGHIFDANSPHFSPTYSLAALFSPAQAIYVDHPVFTLKLLLSRCVENSQHADVNPVYSDIIIGPNLRRKLMMPLAFLVELRMMKSELNV